MIVSKPLKINKMKRSILIIVMIILALSCKAQQIIPIEEYIKYWQEEKEVDEGTYFKDVNHLLDEYVGNWKGIYPKNNYTYEFHIKKRVYSSDIINLKFDELIMRYRITDSNGSEIFSTLSLLDENPYVIKGWYLSHTKTHYVLSYMGKESRCGQSGNIFICLGKTNKDKLYLNLSPSIDMIDCKESAEQILPLEPVSLDRQ